MSRQQKQVDVGKLKIEGSKFVLWGRVLDHDRYDPNNALFVAQALIVAFDWGETEEGQDYWSNVHDSLLRVAYND
jgi:hypothetical protein